MAHWLASRRNGQEHDHIQRFDPRFWTVNFPRPMMASVVTTASDALRVTCEFHHAGELAGLIWESEDTLDHPLHAYAINRDYAHSVLRFRWRSGGVIALDAVNGPTLTIEGRDASGAPRAWYIRLWNYAEGSPEDAVVTLPFSALESGFALPGEAIHPSDIDRMFISLVPPGYVPGSSDRLPARAEGWAELSDMSCDGAGAMLEIGDGMLPEHGEQIATAYDDAFNQTPARLVRQLRHLGYRGRVLHYVGMSHFFRLVPGLGTEAARLLADPAGTLCEPARAWHAGLFAALADAGLEPIVSLSYELLADHCPQSWQQYALDGTPARTGWEPPSALLTPAREEAMAWLRAVAANFVALVEAAGLPVRFQIGEPWWWVRADGHCCLYDQAALAIWRAEAIMTSIPTLKMRLYPPHFVLLDRAGALLAETTAGLAQAVRDAASGPAEVSLLVFTPTVLDPEMPEQKRANMPLGWAFPAFDRLQVEDYDWLTAGAASARRNAYAQVDTRLGYPVDRQDYLSGFVLSADDAATFWPRIDEALDEAARRGVAQRFVWALPQVVRDGYTRLPPPPNTHGTDDMQGFDDVSYPLALGTDASASPEFSTSVLVSASGHERRTAQWADARLRFDVGPGIRSESELAALLAFFRARHGPARGFRLADPFDHSSNHAQGAPGPQDQLLGTGDGERSRFALVKRYGEEPEPQVRRITRPRAGTVRIAIDGAETAAFTLDPLGEVVLDAPPAEGAEVRAGFLFDVPVRFAEDRLSLSAAGFAAGQAPSVPLVEIREAT
ncbi:MAG: TIGR02217 family protein [Citromicrobium sp.]|nr:TIGR02217 family protein [Citromicrobium sp.]